MPSNVHHRHEVRDEPTGSPASLVRSADASGARCDSAVTPAGRGARTKPTDRRVDVQGMRGLAVLLVVTFHAGLPLPGGFVGVDVFFVISGFVIARMLATEIAASGTLDLRQFYLRRTRRLLPALALTSTTVALLAILFSPVGAQKSTAFTSIAASLFGANAYLYRSIGYFRPGADLNAMLHTWSLSVEEQFYFVFPSLVLVAWRLAGRTAPVESRRRGVVAAIATVTALSFWISWKMSNGQSVTCAVRDASSFAFYASPTRVWEFGTGVLLVFGEPLARARHRAATACGFLGLGLVVWSAVTYDGSLPFPGLAATVPVAGTALMLVAGGAGGGVLPRLLSSRALVWIGDRSYGWYLWHWPIVVFARALWPQPWIPVAATLVSLLPTCLSYRYVENPIRFAPSPSRRQSFALVATCIVVPMLASLGLLATRRAIAGTRPGAIFGEVERLHADVVRGCDDGFAESAGVPPRCTWDVAGRRGTIWLVGDSNAGQFTEPVVRAGNDASYAVTVATRNACPFADVTTTRSGIPNDACRSFVARTLAAIEATSPNLVIVASASDGYIEEPSTGFLATGRDSPTTIPDEKARLWRNGVKTVIERVSRVAPVLLVHPIPRFHGWRLEACAVWTALWDPSTCATRTSRRAADAWRRRAIESEELAASEVLPTRTLDVADRLCTGDTCSAMANGLWRFHDGGHLSVEGSLELTDAFARPIRELARR